MKRRIFLALAGGMALLPRFVSTQSGSAVPKGTDMDAIARDPDLPSAGNPQGDVTIAAFSDYNCPFCKATERNLDRLVKDDGRVRLVYKDWPILSSASIYGARLALAAKYQDQYVAVHSALMGISGAESTREQMLASVRSSNVDFERLQDDLRGHIGEIDAVLARNAQQARLLHFEGTPTYLVSDIVYNSLSYDGFRNAVASVRDPAASRRS